MKFFTAILSALALAVSTTSATAIAARAGAPKITRPYQGEPWFNLGLQPIIEWDTAGLEQDNSTCTLLLGYVDDNCSCSLRNFDDESDCQHLDWRKPFSLFSLSPRAPVPSSSFFHPWLIWKT